MATETDYALTTARAGLGRDLDMPVCLKFEHRLGRVRRVDRNSFLIERARNKTVLHLGCADEHAVGLKLRKHAHLHAQLAAVTKELWGVDASGEALSELRLAGFSNLIRADVERLDEIDALHNQHFDVVIAGELIEHIFNPGLFLKACRRLCSANTELILTTPNALVYSQTLFALLNREAIHPDHTLMWSPATLKNLVVRSGFAVKEVWVYGGTPCVQLTPKESGPRMLARLGLRCLDAVIRQTVVRFRPWLNNGLIIVARNKTSEPFESTSAKVSASASTGSSVNQA
jgi:2-polyprenyl-3-methyl-5-hydroxy-6-metoxy-1,4-benzoquinol methylase